MCKFSSHIDINVPRPYQAVYIIVASIVLVNATHIIQLNLVYMRTVVVYRVA